MRRRAMKSLSLILGALVSTGAHAQDGAGPTPPDEPSNTDYGIESISPVLTEPATLEDQPPPFWSVIRGKVVQRSTDTPLRGIYLRCGELRARAGNKGVFILRIRDPLEPGEELRCEVRDVDGRSQGGEHRATAFTLTVTEQGFEPPIPEEGLTVQMELEPEPEPEE